MQKGDWILVHAAAGGVGLWLCQLLRSVGAKVIGTASTADKMELAKTNGADYMINYKSEDVVAKVKELTGGQGVAAVFDSTGKDQFDNDFEVVARKGTIVSFGNSVSWSIFYVEDIANECLSLVRSLLCSSRSCLPRMSSS